MSTRTPFTGTPLTDTPDLLYASSTNTPYFSNRAWVISENGIARIDTLATFCIRSLLISLFFVMATFRSYFCFSYSDFRFSQPCGRCRVETPTALGLRCWDTHQHSSFLHFVHFVQILFMHPPAWRRPFLPPRRRLCVQTCDDLAHRFCSYNNSARRWRTIPR